MEIKSKKIVDKGEISLLRDSRVLLEVWGDTMPVVWPIAFSHQMFTVIKAHFRPI